MSLLRRTITRRVDVIAEEMLSELKTKADDFSLFSIALDESTDIKDTAQLLIFVRGINENVEITEERLGMESMMGTNRAVDLYDSVSVCLEKKTCRGESGPASQQMDHQI